MLKLFSNSKFKHYRMFTGSALSDWNNLLTLTTSFTAQLKNVKYKIFDLSHNFHKVDLPRNIFLNVEQYQNKFSVLPTGGLF